MADIAFCLFPVLLCPFLVCARKIIFLVPVNPQMVFHLPLLRADIFQLPDSLFHILKHTFQILIAAHVFL